MLHIANISQTTNNIQHNICIVNYFGRDRNVTKKNAEALLGASKEVGLALNTGETNYILMCHHHSARKSNNIDR